MHTVSIPQAAEAFGLSVYELRKLIEHLHNPSAIEGKRVTEAGFDLMGQHLGLAPSLMAEKKAAAGFVVAEPTATSPEKKEGAPSPTLPATVDLMVSRLCPNPTWVLAFAAGSARDSKPHEVRVPNNRVLKPGTWLHDCTPAGANRFVWGGKVNALITRRI